MRDVQICAVGMDLDAEAKAACPAGYAAFMHLKLQFRAADQHVLWKASGDRRYDVRKRKKIQVVTRLRDKHRQPSTAQRGLSRHVD